MEPLLAPRQQADLAKDDKWKFNEGHLDRKYLKHAYLLARKTKTSLYVKPITELFAVMILNKY